jgi:Ferric reductase like transmembrane component/Ferric reductase NAD binding domain
MSDLLIRKNGTSPTSESPASNTTHPGETFATLFPFSIGVHGVDQQTNYMAVDILAVLLGATVAFILLLRWAKMYTAHQRHLNAMANLNHQKYWSSNRNSWLPWLKKHIFFAPLWRKRHNEELMISSAVSMGTLPGRGHSFLILAWIGFNIGWLLCLPYGDSSKALIATVRGRSGMMAVFNLFPTVVFALRNNPLIWALQVPYDTFQLFHRWCARIFIFETVIHLGAWIGGTRNAGGWSAVKMGLTTGSHAASFDWGMVAVGTSVIILVQAWSPLRHAFYETFLSIHKLMVFFTLVGTLLHLRLDHLPHQSWVFAIFGLWGYDYVIRAIRIVTYNVNFRERIWRSDVIVEALDGDCSRVTFRLPTYWRPRPGAHVQAYIPKFGLVGFHPFSVAWAEVDELSADSDWEAKLPLSGRTLSDQLDYEPTRRTTISLLVRKRTGFTKHLHDRVSNMQGSMCHTWGWIEGFYGGHDSLSSYSDIILFAGGVGITHQIMFCKQLLDGYRDGTVAARRIVLVWSCPNKPCLDWIRSWMNDILTMEHRRECLKIMLFITRQKNPETYLSSSKSVQMVNGRCDPQEIIDSALVERKGAMAVTVCGPGAFADEVRDAVRRRVHIGSLDFIEEAFTY